MEKEDIEIIILGRGGQGSVIASQLLALAAFYQGFESQAFPTFGMERRGAPVRSFVRISKKPILTRAEVEFPDFEIVLDSNLSKTEKINAKQIFVNSTRPIKNCQTFDATSIALKIFQKDITNIAMIAFFLKNIRIIKRENLIKACKEIFSGSILEKNIQIIDLIWR